MSESNNTPPDGMTLTHKEEVKREIIEFAKMVVWFLLLFALLKSCIIEGYEVQGPSMEPTLWENERILVLKLPQKISQLPVIGGFQAFDPGDIIVFESPDDRGKRYVKRVVVAGPKKTPGNTVEAGAQDGPAKQVVRVLIEDGNIYVNHQKLTETYLSELSTYDATNREALLEPGTYFVLGDNRSVSKDSRSFGGVQDNQITGRAILRFWPLSRFGLL